MKYFTTALLAVSGFAVSAVAEDPARPGASANSGKVTREQISYAVGMNIGNNWKQNQFDFDVDVVTKAIRDVLTGSPTQFSEAEARSVIERWQSQRRNDVVEKNKAEAQTFLSENARKEGVKTTASGLQYKVLTEGSGETPKATDTVKVHYAGRLLNGTEFDSSYKRNQPAELAVGGVIRGWTEALQMMKVGSKWELYIPPDLAYGETGRPNIPPNSVLIFEVELLDVKRPEETVQAVSGEIIKVPSAEELKKGAKIEVLKEEDVKKLQEQQKAGQTNKVDRKP